jgi:hypothetical protein
VWEFLKELFLKTQFTNYTNKSPDLYSNPIMNGRSAAQPRRIAISLMTFFGFSAPDTLLKSTRTRRIIEPPIIPVNIDSIVFTFFKILGE